MCTDGPRAALAPVSFGNVLIILTPHVRGPGESGGSRSRFTSAPVAGTVTQSWKGGCTQQGLEIRPRTPATLAPSLPWGGGETAVGSTALEQGLPRRDRPTEVSCLSLGRREDLGPPLGLGREPGDSGIAKTMSPVILRSPSSCNRLIKHLVRCPALPPDGELPGQPAHRSTRQWPA